MNTFKKRTMSLLLTSAMILPLTACGKKKGGLFGNGGVKTAPETIVEDNSTFYNSDIKELILNVTSDKDTDFVDVGQPIIAGDKIFSDYTIDYKMPPEVLNELYGLDYTKDEDVKRANEIYDEYFESGVAIFNMDGTMIDTLDLEQGESIFSIGQDKSGELFGLITSEGGACSMDGADCSLCKIGTDGTISGKTPLKGLEDVGSNMIFTDDGNILLSSYGGFSLISKDGKVIYSKQVESFGGVFMDGGKYYAELYEMDSDWNYNIYLQEIRMTDGELIGEKTKLDSKYAYNLSNGDDGTYYSDGNGLKKLSLSDNSTESVLEWNDADFNHSGILPGSTKIVSSDDIYLVRKKYEESGDTYSAHTYLIHLTKSDTNPHAGQKVITIGGYGELDEAFLDCVVDYNKDTSHKAKINIRDYSAELDLDNDDKDAARAELADKVYLDMLAGTGPDILVDFSEFSQFNNENVLVNLNPMIDGSNGLVRDEYFDNVFHAFETNGKLYQIPVCVDVNGLMINKDLVGDRTGWTYDEFQQIADSLPDDTKILEQMTPDDLLTALMSQATARLIDYENGTVNFESDEFKKILEIAKKYGEKEMDRNDNSGPILAMGNDKFSEGMVATSDCYVYQLAGYANTVAILKGKVGFAGYPSESPVGLSASPMMTLAIAAASPSQEEAWEFIRFMFDHDQQEVFSKSFYSIPLSRKAFDNICKYEVESFQKRKEEYEKYSSQQAEKFYENEITMDMIDEYRSLVEQVSTICSEDPAIMAIVKEEAAAYFADQRSVEDVCRNIQNRTQTIVNERG